MATALAKTLEPFQGTWKFGACESEVWIAGIDQVRTWGWKIQGNQITWTGPDAGEWTLSFSLDPAKSPRHIDFKFLTGPHRGATLFGIYEFKRRSLWICLSDPEANAWRPTDFSFMGGGGRSMIILTLQPEQSGLRASEFGIRLTLLEHHEVREELRLSSRTMMRVAELRQQLRQELSEAFDKRDEAVARGASPGILERFLREANEGKRAELKELLTDGQAERLRQLVLQFLGIRALHDEDVAGVLGLTADQRTQLAELQAQFERKLTPIVEKMMNEPFDGEADWRREFRRHALSLYAEYVPRYRKVLTEPQREQFRRMQGKPLTFPDRPPQLED